MKLSAREQIHETSVEVTDFKYLTKFSGSQFKLRGSLLHNLFRCDPFNSYFLCVFLHEISLQKFHKYFVSTMCATRCLL
jgi:hypothetical protein